MITVGELGEMLNGSVVGDCSLPIVGVSSIDDAVAGDVVIAENGRYFNEALLSSATAIVTCVDSNGSEKPVIRVTDTRMALNVLLKQFGPASRMVTGIDPHVRISDSSRIGCNASIGQGVCIGDNVRIGDNVTVFPSVYIGDGVVIGSNVVIHPNVTIYPNASIGDRVVIHAGAVIGADGFGYFYENGGHQKVQHIGKVILEDDVEIGACSTIDRAKLGVTRIGRGTKIDNLVHIAHNCKIGRNCLVVALAGIAGSSVLGNGVVVAGQAGIKDHVNVGDGAVIAARAGIIGDVDAGAKMSGFPARLYGDDMRSQAAAARLPEMMSVVRELRARVESLEARLGSNGDNSGTGN